MKDKDHLAKKFPYVVKEKDHLAKKSPFVVKDKDYLATKITFCSERQRSSLSSKLEVSTSSARLVLE